MTLKLRLNLAARGELSTTMVAEIAKSLSNPVYPRLREAVPAALVLLGALIAYALIRAALIGIAHTTPEACLVLDILSIAVAGLLSGIRHADIPASLRVLVRGIGAVILVQLAFDGATLFFAPASMLSGVPGLFFSTGTILGLLAGVIGLWRPSFLLPLAFHYVSFRCQYNIVNSIPISETDYRSMLDVGIFAMVGAFMVVAVANSFSIRRPTGTLVGADEFKAVASSLIWACAVGAHLGNYLVSGWTKIRAGGDEPLFWLLHNPTQTSILIGLERGDNPFATWPHLVQFVWNGIVGGGVLLNFFVLGTQIAVPLAVSHRRVLMIFVLLFDLFHIGVYFTLGALFHFWIVVNVLVFMSARRMTNMTFIMPVKLTMLGTMFAGHFLFYTSHLGWLDGAKLASPSFAAEVRDGRMIPVPPVFFGLPSYSIAQTAVYIPDGHFPMRLGGNTYNRADWRDAQSCGPQVINHGTANVSMDAIDRYVREVDAAMRLHPEVKNANLYYFYPHHMVANPFVFREFNKLSMDDVVRYHYIVESVCLGLQDGHLVRNVHKRTDHVINVKN